MAIKNILTENSDIKPNTELLQTLKAAVPQYFDKDGNFKADKFAAELKENNISEARDGYRLSFVGKDYARLQTGQTSETMIVPDNAHNSRPENANSQNVFITGDNLDALRHLQNAYAGKIKMIYIDPPYNTGKEFVYNDQFEFSDEKLKTALGYGDAEINRLKSLQGKSNHSAWLTFMYPRMKLAQKLLTDDGVIFVSIDDNEQANLKLLMDDIFGEGNFLASVIWQHSIQPKGYGGTFSVHHNYTICYQKSTSFTLQSLERTDEHNRNYSNPDKDPNGPWRAGDVRNALYRPNLIYEIVTPSGKLIHPPRNGWRWSKETIQRKIETGEIVFNKEETKITRKIYLSNVEGRTPETIWFGKEVGTTRDASEELKELFDEKSPFDTPKPTNLIKRLIELSDNKTDIIILDFFSGSATTAHAVMQLNAEDGGNRKYIMVQWAESTNPESEARKAGYNTIDEISRERIKRAAAKIKEAKNEEQHKSDLGFKHYRLVAPDINTIDKIIEFDPNTNKLFGDDMIEPFAYPATNTSGLQTILQTWLIQDGYAFNTEVLEIKLANYAAQYVKQSAVLYLIDNGFSHEALKELLNKIGKNELVVNTLILYPYSFSFEQMRELKNNLKSNLEQQIMVMERY